jgi:hypothetical protein
LSLGKSRAWDSPSFFSFLRSPNSFRASPAGQNWSDYHFSAIFYLETKKVFFPCEIFWLQRKYLLTEIGVFDWELQCEVVARSREFLLHTVDAHRATFDATAEPRDFIDAYLQKVARASGKPESSFHGDYGGESAHFCSISSSFWSSKLGLD